MLGFALLSVAPGFAQSVPDSAYLWKGSNFPIYYNRTAFDRYSLDRTFLVPWLPYEGYPVPDPVSWNASPHNNISWEMYFHSLTWLYSDAYGYDISGDEGNIADAQRVILSWIAANPNPPAINRMSWDDHATAFRSSVMTYFYNRYLSTRVTPAEDAAYRQSLDLHAQKLEQYFNAHIGDGNNHDLMSAQALLNLGVNLPELPAAPVWRSRALARIDSLVFEVFDAQDTINREQALGYQIWDINLFRDAWKYLVGVNQPSPVLTQQFLQSAVDFASTAMTPAGRMPAIGETDYGMYAKAALDAYRADGLLGDTADFVLSEGTSGIRPADMLVYPHQGYVLMRPSYGDWGTWRDDLHIVFKAGPPRRVHGHHDWGSFTLSAFGEELLVDSGGPYVYGDPLRQAFMSALSHNVVIADEQDYRPDRGAVIVRSGDGPQLSFAEIDHQSIVGFGHRRALILLKPDTVVIVDRLDAQDGGLHRLDVLFHLARGASVTTAGGRAVAHIGAAELQLEVFGSTAVVPEIVSGQTTPYLLGWVAPSYGTKAEAPVVRYTGYGTDEWFVTVARPSRSSVSAPFVASVSESEPASLVIEISDQTGLHRSQVAFSPTTVSSRSDFDGDGLWDEQEVAGCTSSEDVDSDDDGLSDGEEDANHDGDLDLGETTPCERDSDGDGLADGTESGRYDAIPDLDGGGPISGTEVGQFVADADPASVTSPSNPDSDGDGFADGVEDTNRNGRLDPDESDPASAASVPTQDADGDGVLDVMDNCLLRANADQWDSDGDLFGNACDADLDNDRITNAQDLVLFRQQLGRSGPAGSNAADLNGNGVVNSQDSVIFRGLLGSPPGPSGMHPR